MKTFDDLRENPGYQLWLVTNAWQRSLRKVLHPLGLTHAQFAVLASIGRLEQTEETITQAHVCRCGSLDQNMASDVIRSLESRGLLARLEHPNDRRAHRLELTEDGKRLVADGREALAPVKEAFFAPLPDNGKSLAKMLETLVNAAEAEGR